MQLILDFLTGHASNSCEHFIRNLYHIYECDDNIIVVLCELSRSVKVFSCICIGSPFIYMLHFIAARNTSIMLFDFKSSY